MSIKDGLSGHITIPKATGSTTSKLNAEVKGVIINASTNGDNTIVSAVAGKKIRVVSLFFICAGTTTVRFESGAGGNALTGVMAFTAQTGMVLPHNEDGWFNDTATGDFLNMELNAAVSVQGALRYIEV